MKWLIFVLFTSFGVSADKLSHPEIYVTLIDRNNVAIEGVYAQSFTKYNLLTIIPDSECIQDRGCSDKLGWSEVININFQSPTTKASGVAKLNAYTVDTNTIKTKLGMMDNITLRIRIGAKSHPYFHQTRVIGMDTKMRCESYGKKLKKLAFNEFLISPADINSRPQIICKSSLSNEQIKEILSCPINQTLKSCFDKVALNNY